MKIRIANQQDFDAIWEIFKEVVKTGDTYVFDPNTSKEKALGYWTGENYYTYVAEIAGNVLGTYLIRPNQPDLGSHVANAAYMVHPNAHGKGIGKAIGLHSIEQARKHGFKAMQFNFVVATNTLAVNLWQKVGFKIIGTVPEAYQHLSKGLVDVYIMHLKL